VARQETSRIRVGKRAQFGDEGKAIAFRNSIGSLNEVAAHAHMKVRIEAGATGQVDNFVADFAARHGLSNDDRARTLIVLEELVTNLLKYGYPDRPDRGVAEVALSLDGSRLTIEIVDDGDAFDPCSGAAPDLDRPLESRAAGGLGLHIVRMLTEGMRYSRTDDHNVTQLTLLLCPPSQP
jgi:anti-sigma regulatory factor (Ser/Thr protein kinase)